MVGERADGADETAGETGAIPLTRYSRTFHEAQRPDHSARVTWHPGFGCFILSLWHDGVCAASFRLSAPEVGGFLDAFTMGGETPAPREQRHSA